jgi:hypothetical protein
MTSEPSATNSFGIQRIIVFLIVLATSFLRTKKHGTFQLTRMAIMFSPAIRVRNETNETEKHNQQSNNLASQ